MICDRQRLNNFGAACDIKERNETTCWILDVRAQHDARITTLSLGQVPSDIELFGIRTLMHSSVQANTFYLQLVVSIDRSDVPE
jgi:hypothetical protein